MDSDTISTKELRHELPRIREGLASGKRYTLIYRSKPIARLEPLTVGTTAGVRVKGGSLRLQEHSKQLLTPDYLNELAAGKYE